MDICKENNILQIQIDEPMLVMDLDEYDISIFEKIDKDKLWINPDCGLKTRGEKETKASLINLVKAAKEIRNESL